MNLIYGLLSKVVLVTYESLSFRFFFSSRRRHTRSLCDWSSDGALPICGIQCDRWPGNLGPRVGERVVIRVAACRTVERDQRSEERRVGKECRSRWSQDH